jgi:hypothetical protein
MNQRCINYEKEMEHLKWKNILSKMNKNLNGIEAY